MFIILFCLSPALEKFPDPPRKLPFLAVLFTFLGLLFPKYGGDKGNDIAVRYDFSGY
jgi:hypothetical protein